ncbi:MAG TPA: flagellar hook-length control protein FliK, partial [Candidatus Acidoferrum sp.]|nr:flagellar hook-length control protein FliK [Candidatus Acidoferrum sp.]
PVSGAPDSRLGGSKPEAAAAAPAPERTPVPAKEAPAAAAPEGTRVCAWEAAVVQTEQPTNAPRGSQADTPALSLSEKPVQVMSQNTGSRTAVTPGAETDSAGPALAIDRPRSPLPTAHAGTPPPPLEPPPAGRQELWGIPFDVTGIHESSVPQAVTPARGAEARGDEEEARQLPAAPPRAPGRRADSSEQLGTPLESPGRLPPGPSEAPSPPVSPMGIERVATAVRTSAARGGMEVRLRLHPESLGEVQVHVRWERGLLTARLEAATPAARDALEGGLHLLKSALQEQGVSIDRLQVGLRLNLEGQSQGHTPPRQAGGDLPERPPLPDGGVSDTASLTAAPPGRLDVRI